MAVKHANDTSQIITLCEEMTLHENSADQAAHDYFARLLPKDFVFRRIDGSVDSKGIFLTKLVAGMQRKLLPQIDVHFYDHKIAVASLVIEGTRPNEPVGHYRNFRVFRRREAEDQADGVKGWVCGMWHNTGI